MKRPIRSRFAGPLLVGLFAFIGASCDALPEVSTSEGRAPVLSNLVYSPQILNLADAAPGQVVDDMVQVNFSVTVTANDPDGEVTDVWFILRSPTIGAQPIRQLPMTASGGQFSIEEQVVLPKGETGNYTVLVFGGDNDGLRSNQLQGRFALLDTSEPPVIEEVIAPETVERPDTGETTFEIVAVVSDPDGLGNITSVVFWNVNTPASTITMFDDGANGGDAVAGDGRYTITVSINANNALGTNTLAFQATDRAGLTSNIIEKQITIE